MFNRLKSIVSVFLCCAMVSSFLSTMAAQGELYVNESFNSYSTNERPATLKIDGKRSYVDEYAEEEKGYKFLLNSSYQGLQFPAVLKGEYFISFDLFSDGKINGKLAVLNGSTEFVLLNFEDGDITSHNAKEIGGVGKNIKNITVVVNSTNSSYSVYIGGKSVLYNSYISNLTVKEVDTVKFMFNSSLDACAVIDNINIGGGKMWNKYPIAVYNSASYEKLSFEPNVPDEIYTYVDFDKTTNLSAGYNGKSNILEKTTEESGNKCILFKRESTDDFHLDINTNAYQSDSIVYQYDIKIIDNDTEYRSSFKATNGIYAHQYKVTNGILSVGSKSVNLADEQWHTVSFVYNVYDNCFNIYVDYAPVGESVPITTGYDAANASIWRLHAQRSSGADYFYVDNVAIYSAVAPKKIDLSSAAFSESMSCWPKDDTQKQYLRDKVSYHLRSGVLYAYEKKTIVEPTVTDGTTFVPAGFFEKAFSYSVNTDVQNKKAEIGDFTLNADSYVALSASGNITLSKKPYVSGGEFYVPLRDFVTLALKKQLYYDDTATNSGLILISNNEITVDSRIDLQALNNFAFYERPDTQRILQDYNDSALMGVHPRILADKSDFDRIRNLYKSDKVFATWVDGIISQADGLVGKKEPLKYELRDGVRLFYVSLDMISNMTILGMAYQVTGNKKYAERAYIDLDAVANFPDWHPAHHIDVGSMAIGYCIGYDWMYDAFSTEQLKNIEDGAYKNGLMAYVDGYQGNNDDMEHGVLMTNNHNMFMNSGSTLLGLSLMDVYPEYSAYCISGAVRCLENAIVRYAPEGSWDEGTGYGTAALEYGTYILAGLDKVFGTDYSLDKTEGVNKIVDFYLYMQSPQGTFGFSDSSSQNFSFDSGMLWVADHFNEQSSISTFYNLYGFTPNVRTILWYRPEFLSGGKAMQLDKVYQDQQAVTMRDSWNEEEQTTFAAIKGGKPSVTHGHLDAGTFAFYANGVQWTYDFGSEDYNLAGYWDGTKVREGQRWNYYRLRAEGHNCVIINPDEYAEYMPDEKAMLTKFESKPRGAMGIIDLTKSLSHQAKRAERGFNLTDDRKSFVVRDEITTKDDSTIYWFMHTKQDAVVSADGKGVILYQKGNELNYVNLDFACSEEYQLEVRGSTPLETSPQPYGMADDSGTNVIVLKTKGNGEISITAKLTPCTVDNPIDVKEFDKPFKQWVILDGEIPKKPVLDYISVDGVDYSVTEKNIIHYITADTVSVPETVAQSSNYAVDINKALSLDDITVITVSDKNDPSNKTVYRIQFNLFTMTGLQGYKEYPIAKVEVSDEPQPENPKESLIDRDLTTRWSSEGSQYVVLDMGKEIEFDNIIMAFMSGNARKYNLTFSVSNDKINFKEVFSGNSSGKSNDYEAFSVGKQKARYIRISGNGSSANQWNSWTEVAVAAKE